MRRFLFFMVGCLCVIHNLSAQTKFAPGAGNVGSTAIYLDSTAIKSWATGVELYRGWINIADTSAKYNGTNKASFGYPAIALGKAKDSPYDVISLGDSGIAILSFDRPIANGKGTDFAVFENGFYTPAGQKSTTFSELAFVEVSSDGKRFVRFPAVSLTPQSPQFGGFAAIDPTNIYNLAGKDIAGYGTPFDLDDIKDSAGIDLNNIRFVKVVDVVGNIQAPYASHDSKGHIVNDPWPTPFHSCGFDLDAVSVLNAGQPYFITTFDELPLAKDSWWSPTNDTSWASGLAKFRFYHDTNFDYGFMYSNNRNDTAIDQSKLETSTLSAITKGGMNAPDTGGTNYAVAFVAQNWLGDFSNMPVEMTFNDDKSYAVSGFYITNCTYAYLSMKNGDMFAKKFGGKTGIDPDYFKILIWGEKQDGSKTDTIEFYLADFRFADNSKDYIVNNWRWVDVSKLGKVKKLRFNLASSDVGQWGMNTPAYFCLDNLTVIPDAAPVPLSQLADVRVKMNAQPVNVDLGSAFTAYEPLGVALAIASNTNTELVQTAISGKTLTLSFIPDKTGEAQIVVSATVNSQTVTNTFKVAVTNSATDVFADAVNNIKVYPNPFKANVTVECDANSQVILLDLFGRKIVEQAATGSTIQLSTEGLTSGYYLLKIINESESQTIKVLKQ